MVIPDTVNSGDVIRVDYVLDESQTKELSYTVEYYRDGVLADTEVERAVVQVLQPDTMTVNKEAINLVDKYFGYRLADDVVVPDTVNSGDVIRIDYITDDRNTKELNYTVEYYKDGVKQENDTQTKTQTVQVLEADTLAVDKTVINVTDKYEGYYFDSTDPENIPDVVNTGTVIKVNYVVRTDLSYTVEYYFNNVIDDTLTEIMNNQTYGAQVETYTDKVKVGYKLDRVETLPMTIGVNENIVRVYYVTDEAQTKELSYTVEYYKDGVLADTDIERSVVQVLQPDTMTVNKDAINLVDKYLGYKTENVVIPDTVTNGDVIRVDYVLDETQTKELSYTVEYYKDGVLADTEVERTVVQVLEPDTIVVNKTAINLVDKYLGYKTENVVIPDTVNNGDVIRVDYVLDETQTKELSYTVEYYKDGVLADTDVKTVVVHILESDVLEVDKESINIVDKYNGYKLAEGVVIPDTVNSGDTIRVDYVIDENQTKELNYTVEYYKDNVLADSEIKTVNVQVLEPDVIEVDKESINIVDKYSGYKYERTEPETIPNSVESGSTIKVYYVIDISQTKEVSYTVEYYKDGVLDTVETETRTVHILASDEIEVDKTKINIVDKYTGYKVSDNTVIPDTIENGGIIRIEYVLDDTQTKELSYTVEYYKDGYLVEQETKSEVIQILGPNTLLVDLDVTNLGSKYEGYRLEKTEPETIPNVVEDGTVIKVFYVSIPKIVISYTNIVTGETIKDDVVIEGTYNESYDLTDYLVEIEEYTLVKYPELTGIYTDKELKVTFEYARNTNVIVKYLEKDTEIELLPEERIEGYEGKAYNSIAKDIENYVLAESQNNIGTMKVEPIVVKHYYLAKVKVIINHINKNTNEVIEVEEFNGKLGDTYTAKAKDFDGFKVDQIPENETVTLTKDDIVLNYYYVKIPSGVIEKHIDVVTNEILDSVLYEGDAGDDYETFSKDIEKYDLITNKTYYKYNLENSFTDEEFEELMKTYNTSTKEELLENYEEELILEAIQKYNVVSEDIYMPTNAKGKMQKELIEVKYYYNKQAVVKVEYIDFETGENFKEVNEAGEEVDIIDIYNGHIGDEYNTNIKEFEGYKVIENMMPDNSKGEMNKEEIIVKYYYEKVQKKVVEEHRDIIHDDKLHEEVHIGDDITNIEEKEFDGFIPATNKIYYEILVDENPDILKDNGVDSVEDLLVKLDKQPEETFKSEVEKNEDTLIIQYYYVREAKVKVVYVDKNTGEEIKIMTQDGISETTENISGYEGKTYDTIEKSFDNYSIVKEMYPNNARGKMAVLVDSSGTYNNETLVKYYYVEKSAGVVEKHIDSETNTVIKEIKHEGNVGDRYVISESKFDGYEILKDKYPTNKEGTMTKEQIVVEFYYKKVEPVIPDDSNDKKPTDEPTNNPTNNPTDNKPNEDNVDKVIIADTNNKANTINNIITNNNNNTHNVIQSTNKETNTPATGDNIMIVVIILISLIVLNVVYMIKKEDK